MKNGSPSSMIPAALRWITVAAAHLFIIIALSSGAVAAQTSDEERVPFEPDATGSLSLDRVDGQPAPAGERDPKISSRLLAIARSHGAWGNDWPGATDTTGLLVSKNAQVLTEVRFSSSAAGEVQAHLLGLGGTIRNQYAAGAMEVWLPAGAIHASAAHPQVEFLSPAALARPVIGNSLTQGLAASGADLLQTAGIDGSGVVIANIDGGYTDYALRQATGDWPTGASLTTFDIDGGGFGGGTRHGTATLEINYDVAPGATYLAYEISTKGDWYGALVDAGTVQGADIASVSLGMPLDGVGDGTALPGSIAEAAGMARAAGMLVVNAAGNERDNHWGGLYSDSETANTHDWGSGGNLLTTGAYCYSIAFPRFIELYWDDWTNVDHDYDLELYQINPGGTGWVLIGSSTNVQDGTLGQKPQEYVAVQPTFHSKGCGPGYGYFGLLVRKISAASDRNLQVFLDYTPRIEVHARSLGFPGDSPNVFTVAAIDVTSSVQEVYSSEGPVLGPGGSLGASSIAKPDAASFANVDTEAYGAGIFNGTSSATPHVAGLAALLLQNDPFLTISQLETELHNIGLSGNNDLGVAGFDTQYGYGRIRLPDADMSDHPGSYGVAWHANPSDEFSISLGPVNDTDSTATAGSDDDADDGVIRTGPWVQGQTATLNANVVGGPGHLVGWVDWSGDGDFLDGGEEVISQTVAAGSNGLTLSVPGTYTTGTPVQTRFRLYTASPAVARPMGHASDGEVEDYSWSFTPTTVGLQSVEAGRGSMGGSWMVVAAGGALSALTAALLWRRKRGQRASRSQRSMAS